MGQVALSHPDLNTVSMTAVLSECVQRSEP